MIGASELFIGYTVFASILTLLILYKNFRFFFWKKTEGTIIRSQPKRVESIVRYETYEPDLEYIYTVEGKEFKSNKLFITDFQSDLKTIEKVLAELKPSHKVIVYYNPKNPSEAILKRKLHAGMVVQLIALIGIMLPFLFQALVETAELRINHQNIANTVKQFLHSIFD